MVFNLGGKGRNIAPSLYLISGKRSNAVLVAEEDWAAIQETLFLLSVPGMRESIKAGVAESIDSCATELDW